MSMTLSGKIYPGTEITKMTYIELRGSRIIRLHRNRVKHGLRNERAHVVVARRSLRRAIVESPLVVVVAVHC